MFTDAQLAGFDADGVVHLPGVLSADQYTAMQERVWRLLARNGVDRHDRSTWQRERSSHLQATRRGDPQPAESPPVRAALDGVFGAGNWRDPSSWGQVLVTFPSEQTWTVPSAMWHLDHSYAYPRKPIFGVNLFLFITDVEPRGGGTLVVRSSPRLIARFVEATGDVRTQRQGTLRRRFDRSHAWLRELTSSSEPGADRIERFMAADANVDGIPARVVELTGRAGDAVLCHPWIVHASSSNATDRPRLMRACRVYHRDLLAWRETCAPTRPGTSKRE